ncbi:MepB family protein [Nocardia sp. NPDC058176]|uniref:MepB family protein n=1 Tax=Nocardia sp. NPDC058176 TaxID=3346368 RepID=UPI0036DDC7DD
MPPTTEPSLTSDPAEFNAWSDSTPVHGDLVAAKALVYDPSGFVCSQPIPEVEGSAYGAHTFVLDGLVVRFRTAKTTPTKLGQFVTVWIRSAAGPIRPFDLADPIDLVVVGTRDPDRFGQFVFPLGALRRHAVVSVDGVGGKRAFRVYPPWVSTDNRQAAAAQAWQLGYFLDLPSGEPIDLSRARQLYRTVS